MIDLNELSIPDGLEPVELALLWAGRGLPVLPTDPETKAPWIGKQWEKKATTDPETIRGWEGKWKQGARVGIKTGLACGCGCLDGPDVLDFDVSEGKPGIEQRRLLVDAGILDGTQALRLVTPSGGEHWWFEGTDQHNKQNDDSVWGVDLRAHHGMVLAPGNPGYQIKAVPWAGLGKVDWARVAACPGLRVKPPKEGEAPKAPPTRAKPPATPAPASKLSAPSRFDNAPGEESPMDWYSRTHDLGKLLFEDGWTYAYTSAGRDYYVRPGKEAKDGISGNVWINPDGRQTFVNFSTSVDLPTDRGMSAAQWYAYRHHRGDFGAAAKQIRNSMMPRREPVVSSGPLVAPPTNSRGLAGMDVPPAAPRPPEATRSAELVPVAEVGPPPMVTEFWDERWELKQIRHISRERGVSPWAALGAVLALVTCRVGPHVVLPPIVGGVASLNLLIGLVGPSGKGKGAAWNVAEEYLDLKGKFAMEEVGTSQGIDSCFTETSPKAGSIQFNDVAFFYVPEIDTMRAHSEMSGSALLPHLRKIWSGEALGARYAKTENRRPVKAHSYRASVVAGIQPARAGVLLADADGGTPQRWLWLPVFDPDALDPRAKLVPPPFVKQPPAIDFDVWVPAGEQRGEKHEPMPVEMKSRYEMAVCKEAQDEIRQARYENLRTESGSMDSHSLLTRLKVAAAFAFLDRRAEVLLADWDLAKAVMWVSNVTRSKCEQAVAEVEREEHIRRGRGRAHQDAAADVARVQIRDARVERVQHLGGKVLQKLQSEPGKEWSPRALIKSVMDAKTAAEYSADVLAALIATPGVVEGPETSSGGHRVKKLRWEAHHVALRPTGESSGESR